MARSSRPVWLGEDARGWDHVRVHLAILRDDRIGTYELAVYLGLAAHAELRSGEARPSLATLAGYAGMSERKAQDAVKVLADAGWIEVDHRQGKASMYRLLAPPPIPIRESVTLTKPDARRLRIGRRDGWFCWYCLAPLVPLDHVNELCTLSDGGMIIPPVGFEWPTLDNVVPLSGGGTDLPDNHRLACARCNRRKGTAPAPDRGAWASAARGAGVAPLDVESSAAGHADGAARGAYEQEPLNENKEQQESASSPNGAAGRSVKFGDERVTLGWQVPDVVTDEALQTAVDLCSMLGQSLAERGEVVDGKPLSRRWVLDMEQLVRLDGRSPAKVAAVIAWLHRGDDDTSQFWRSNVRSPGKLRCKWMQMAEQYVARKVNGRRAPKVDVSDDAQRILDGTYGRRSVREDRLVSALPFATDEPS